MHPFTVLSAILDAVETMRLAAQHSITQHNDDSECMSPEMWPGPPTTYQLKQELRYFILWNA